MKERPILFSAPMVRAILSGTKTQTRRVVKGSEKWPPCVIRPTAELGRDNTVMGVCARRGTYGPTIKSPYGGLGDGLWVREAWACLDSHKHPGARLAFRADTEDGERVRVDAPWVPSIHMPRWASRLDLEVTGVRVERLQDINEADAIAEGLSEQPGGGWGLPDGSHYHGADPRISYWSLWEAINGRDSVEANPWVWAVQFKVQGKQS